MPAERPRRLRSRLARTASRAVIAPAKWGSPDERTPALGGLFSRQDLSRGGRRPFFAKERSPGAGGRELLHAEGALVRHRRRIRFGQVNLGAYRFGARPAGLRRGAPRGALAVRFATTRIARVARPHANGVPGPLRFARSAPAHRKDRRRAAGGVGRSEQGRAPRARSSVARGGRTQGFGRFEAPA